MTQFHIVAAIALFSFTTTAFGATVSGEITSKSIVKNPKTTVVTPIKKAIPKIVVRTYTRTVSYVTPTGKESIIFTVRYKNGVIVGASATPKSKKSASLILQRAFARNLNKAVSGKSIKNFDIEVIAGAALETQAFEEFIQKII
ncbi:hypothetical protein K2X92_00850 [Candidatus Gracilibacteria bacterium]|nr:hypothetical protein [Candidatus Gracilibacteria bacterium]